MARRAKTRVAWHRVLDTQQGARSSREAHVQEERHQLLIVAGKCPVETFVALRAVLRCWH